MTIATKRQRAQNTLLVLIFTLSEAALMTWLLSWTNSQ
jgi:hypothetical protein